MFVRFLGFSVEAPKAISVEEVMKALAKQATNYESFDEAGRFLFVDTESDGEYYLGLIVTVKSQRTFCELREAGSSFKVQVNKLDRNSNIMEFNFFIINKESGVGLYQHYHQSCSIGQGMNLIKKRFNELKGQKREQKKNDLIAGKKNADKAEKMANKEFKGFFKWQLLIRKEKLASVLKELEHIKALEVDLSYLEPDSKEFGQLSGFVIKQKRKFSFGKKFSPSSLIDLIVSAVNRSKTDSGRVFGVDEDGLDRIIKIQNNPDNFGEFGYDEVAEHINNLDVLSFQSSWIIKNLREVCQNHSSIFKAKIK
ncbi:conserved hypothetical protein [Nitrosomonas mobilis]|uniref:Uncharacterized protein n=1 Tax=Nitrosomonas mobilis TaxID=51642 RepID=A0A1G5SI47_9PROT|nr:conserved hypothetical protein [Nitrosomonas mobilis]